MGSASEMVAVKRALEPELKAEAEQRQKAGIQSEKPLGKFPEGGRTSNVVGSYAGVSGKTLEKAEAVVEAAKTEL